MKVLVTGATGLVGQHLVRRLLEGGHDVVALSRNLDEALLTLPVRCMVHEWNPEAGHLDGRAWDGVRAVVHLAGENVGAARWSRRRKDAILKSRALGTRTLVESIGLLPPEKRPKIFVSASAIGFYGDRGDEILEETASHGEDFLADVCRVWEHEARRSETHGLRWVSLRTGIVLAREGGALAKMLPLFRVGLGGRLGSGDQWMSWIHIADLVSLYMLAIENDELEGPVNAVAPNPVTNKQFTRSLARVLRRPALAPAPATMLRMMLGEMSSLVLGSQRVVPVAADDAGFKFDYEDLELALRDLCLDAAREMRQELWLDSPASEVFAFFSDPQNLEEITPQFLGFRIVKAPDDGMTEGSTIDYRIRLHRLPVRWRSRIDVWDPPRTFVDTQVKGPYKSWRHTHEFEALDGGTLVRDVVRYELPFGALGEWLAGKMVERDLALIFAYRRTRLLELFDTPD
ncbi:MAG TPA: TIGR01777 family oxidoreductase [Candidatus Binatia bacterium]|nr:TIGR01777 family oxidoreductase [Candidatus Binatia bacterium]